MVYASTVSYGVVDVLPYIYKTWKENKLINRMFGWLYSVAEEEEENMECPTILPLKCFLF